MRMISKPFFKPASGGGGGGSLPSATPTLRYEIGNLDSGTLVWTDSSGNSHTGNPSGTPVKGTILGLEGATYSGGDQNYDSAVPFPTDGGTLFVFAKVDSGNPSYAVMAGMRNTANNRNFQLYILGSSFGYIYNGRYDFGGTVYDGTKWCLYAITVSTSSSKLYRIDDTGTTVTTDTHTHSHQSASDVPFWVANDNNPDIFTSTQRAFEGSIRHVEYHKNLVLTQSELEDAYTYLIS